ncbi:MAG TPA: M23 family metallopeptidase [Candidatus Tectomicrobia bacterium]
MWSMQTFFPLLVIVLVVGTTLYILPHLERHPPTVEITLDSVYVGRRPFDVALADTGKGLQRVSIGLTGEHGIVTLLEKEYPAPTHADTIHMTLDPQTLQNMEGVAEIRVLAEDRSFWQLWHGNTTTVTKKAIIDVTPPRIEVRSREHYIYHGGAGLVIYTASADAVRSGVQVGDYFFPGQPGYFATPELYLAFFAYPYNVDPAENIVVFAQDAAGNAQEARMGYRLKTVPYRASTLHISDAFIGRKIQPLLGGEAVPPLEPKEAFLHVNRDLRQVNDAAIQRLGAMSGQELLWHGAFHQLTNSQVEANFADARTYVYAGEVIDHQYHLGCDLAVTRHYPIEAANDGVVVFAGDLGIYGNTVIIDHGYGVHTLYGHMSAIDINVGDKVQKKQLIGRTGETGLATGDHLHYGVYIYGVPVRPEEWWDEHWVNDNILRKIRQAAGEAAARTSQW